MIEAASASALREAMQAWRQQSQRIGFVPTMGNLHDGHLALVREAQRHSDRVAVSIFVNPMQFDRKEDLDRYPRTLQADLDKLRVAGVDIVFLPSAELLYPQGLESMTRVQVPALSERLEGASRPGHFVGMATVVTKLFNIVQPALAVFGEKDFQQLAIIRKFTRDLDMPVQIMALPTVREADGLAMSSRNGYLSIEERSHAPLLYQTLQGVRAQIIAGNRDYRALEQQALAALSTDGLIPDYVEICHADSLLPATVEQSDLVILASAWLGKARLIDNIPLTVPTL